MAVSRVGSWLAFTHEVNVDGNGQVDPTGTVTIGSGSNRMLVFIQLCELSAQLTASLTIGGASASYTGYVYQDASPDLNILVWIWDESDIGGMTGSTISYSDSQSNQKHGWTYATFQDVDQGVTPAITTNHVIGGQTFDLTTTSDSDDIVVVGIIDKSNNRYPLDSESLDVRVEWHAQNMAIAVADGAGGDDTTTVKNDEVANSNIAGLAVVLTAASEIKRAGQLASIGVGR